MEKLDVIKLAATSLQDEIVVRGGENENLKYFMKQFGYITGVVARTLCDVLEGLSAMFSSCERRV